MVMITIAARELAKIGEKSSEYEVTAEAGGETFLLTSMRYHRRANGRRDRAYMDCLINGRIGKIDCDAILTIRD